MKKQNKIPLPPKAVSDPAASMVREAQDRTERARAKAEEERLADWVRALVSAHILCSEEFSVGENARYACREIFDGCKTFLEARRREIETGYSSPADFSYWGEIVEIFAFSFNYAYDESEWDGDGLDPDDDSSFFVSEVWERAHLYSNKRNVAAAFRDYLVAGALAAKRIGSAAYDAWADALTAFDYTFREFGDGADREETRRFVDRVRLAAGRTCVDHELEKRIREVEKKVSRTPPPSRKKSPKKGK